jgi:hypothetical protein
MNVLYRGTSWGCGDLEIGQPWRWVVALASRGSMDGVV